MTTQIPAGREHLPPTRPTADRAVPGTLVGGRYELRSPIGHGGMGTVWRATDTLLRREVAVKEVLLPPAMPISERDALCERTLREARYDLVLDAQGLMKSALVAKLAGAPVAGFDRANLRFEVVKTTSKKDKAERILERLKNLGNESAIVYCGTRKNVEEVTDFLQNQGIKVARYHAGLSDEQIAHIDESMRTVEPSTRQHRRPGRAG